MEEIKEIVEFLTLKNYLVTMASLILLIDAYIYLNKYWITMAQIKVESIYNKKKLDYNIQIVKKAYGMLASNDEIDKAILVVRELEDELNVEPFDFESYKIKYNEDLNKINERGYF